MDVLFALNMIISFFLISAAKRLCRQQAKTIRVLAGSMLGGAYSLAVFLPEVHTAVNIIFRVLFMLLLTAVVFGFKSVKKYFRSFFSLLGVSFILAGLLMAVWLIFKPEALLVKNGAVYFDIGFLTLVLSAAALYAVLWLGKRLLAPKANEKAECNVGIRLNSANVNVKGIVDTGNTLVDSFTGKKVSIIDKTTALYLLPFDAAACIADRSFEKLPPYMHLTVSNTVGGEGLLPVFTADLIIVEINGTKHEIKNPAVAVSDSDNFGGFSALINSELIGVDELDKKTDTKNKAAFSTEKKQSGLLHKRSADSARTAER